MTKQRYNKIQKTLMARQLDAMLILDKVHKPYNLAAMMRTCDAVGIQNIHAIYPKPAIRTGVNASAGTKRWVDVTLHRTIDAAITLAKAENMLVLGAHPDKKAVDYRDIDYTQPVAIVMGSELEGFSEHSLSLLDQTIKIPMHGMGQSLNVSVAAALILFEFERQRSASGAYNTSQYNEERLKCLSFEWAQPKLSTFCAENKMPYPDLDAEGDIAGSIDTQ